MTIAADMHYHLPNITYLEYINRNLLQRDKNASLVDPLAIDIPQHKLESAYVERKNVQYEVSRQGSQVIIGRHGCGKTTLLKHIAEKSLSESLSDGSDPLESRTLIVKLPLADVIATVGEKELLEGEASCLTTERLASHIFETFWQQIPLKAKPLPASHHAPFLNDYLQILRRDTDWMLKLRWFYQRYHPLPMIAPGDFELMAWLQAEHTPYFNTQLQDEEALRQLVLFITKPIWEEIQFGKVPPWPYDRVQIYIDGIERLSNHALSRLFQDTQKLQDMALGYVDVKLFVDPTCRDYVQKLDCVQQGRICLYEFPQWTQPEIEALLNARIRAWMPQENPESLSEEWSWVELLVRAGGIQTRDTRTIIDIITRGALQSYRKSPEDKIDAPVHALRLARGMVAACAGCWGTTEVKPPLNAEQCSKIIEQYWSVSN